MKKLIVLATLAVGAPTMGHAQGIAVFDRTNRDIAEKNANNTNKIMDSNADILSKSKEILEALSGSRNGSLGIAGGGLAGGMSIAKAPSFGSVLNGGTFSFGGLGGDAQKIASSVINGLQLAKQLQSTLEGTDSPVNKSYGGMVNTASLLSALTQQASQGVTQREQSLQSATGSIGQAENVKGSVDENTRMQLETARSINELIGVQNGQVSALNEKMKMDLLRQSQVKKMMEPVNVDPFKNMGSN